MPTLKIPEYELNLKAVLQPGQSYRWRSNYGVFYGVVDGILLELKRVNSDEIHWECLGRSMRAEGIDIPEKLREYFQLDVSLMDLWDKWSAKDLLMADLRPCEDVQGLRILKQEPLEALLATICAINAGIDRSSIIINSMAQLYGDLIAIDQSTVGSQVVFLFPELRYAFPTLLQLTRVQDLLEPFFCKHLVPPAAKCLSDTIKLFGRLPRTYLTDVQQLQTEQIRQFLLSLPGMSPQVAECVALTSLGQNQCFPMTRQIVDITAQYYLPCLQGMLITNALIESLTDFYERKFGTYAGWIQAVLCVNGVKRLIKISPDSTRMKSTELSIFKKSKQNDDDDNGKVFIVEFP